MRLSLIAYRFVHARPRPAIRDFSAATARAFVRFLADAASFFAERDFPPLEPISLAVNFSFIAPAKTEERAPRQAFKLAGHSQTA